MGLEVVMTLLLGGLAFRWGMGIGRLMLRRGATANDLFKNKPLFSLLALVVYLGLLFLALNLPQMQLLPLEWRVYGMQVTWTLMRVLLLGFCGLALRVSWQTARKQVGAIALLGVLGLGSFTLAEAHFLAPIHASLSDNLQPNGVFKQSSTSSCAPAAMATVLRQWGLEATESGVAKLAKTSLLGTSMPQLIVAVRSLGLDGLELSPTWEQMQQMNRPGVLSVWSMIGPRKLPHAVALLAMTPEFVVIGDPAHGKLYQLTEEQLTRIWRQEYVPVFRPGETTLAPERAAEYLIRMDYLQAKTDLPQALRQFQHAIGVEPTGKLTPETVLLLTGSYLTNVPTLLTSPLI